MSDDEGSIIVPHAPLDFAYKGQIDDFYVDLSRSDIMFPVKLQVGLVDFPEIKNNATAKTFSSQLLLPVEESTLRKGDPPVEWDWTEGHISEAIYRKSTTKFQPAVLYSFRRVHSWESIKLRISLFDANNTLLQERIYLFEEKIAPFGESNTEQEFFLKSGAYQTTLTNTSTIHHPKTWLTQNGIRCLFDEEIFTPFTLKKVVYLGLDTGENLFAVIRTLRSLGLDFSETSLLVIGDAQWDEDYRDWLLENTELGSILDQHQDSRIELLNAGDNPLSNYGADLVVGTYVLQWALDNETHKNASAEHMFRELIGLLSEKGIFLSVEHSKPQKVHRGGQHASELKLEKWFSKFGLHSFKAVNRNLNDLTRQVWSRNKSILRSIGAMEHALKSYKLSWLDATEKVEVAGFDAKLDLLPLEAPTNLTLEATNEKQASSIDALLQHPATIFHDTEPIQSFGVTLNKDPYLRFSLTLNPNSTVNDDDSGQGWGGKRWDTLSEPSWRQESTSFLMNLLLSKKNAILSGTASSGKSIFSQILFRTYLKQLHNSNSLMSMGGSVSFDEHMADLPLMPTSAVLCQATDIIRHWIDDNLITTLSKASCAHPKSPSNDWNELTDLLKDKRLGRWLIIIDGFDEIHQYVDRKKLVEAIKELETQYSVFITTRPAQLKQLEIFNKREKSWAILHVSDFVPMTARQEFPSLNKQNEKDFRIWDLMLMEAWGETVSKFNPSGDIHHGGGTLNDPSNCWPRLRLKDMQAPTPMDRSDLLADNISNGKWIENRLNGAVVEGTLWEQPRYKSINIWTAIRKPRYQEHFVSKIGKEHPDLCEKPVLNTLYSYHRTIAFLCYVLHNGKPIINHDTTRQRLISKLFEFHDASDALKNLTSDQLYKILFESSTMMFIANDDHIEWNHKTHWERLCAEFLLQSERNITSETISKLLVQLGYDPTKCTYPAAFGSENAVDWLTEIYTQTQQLNWGDKFLDEYDYSQSNLTAEAGLAATCMLVGIEEDIFPSIKKLLEKEWMEQNNQSESMIKTLFQWNIMLQIMIESQHRISMSFNGFWRLAWAIQFQLLERSSSNGLLDYVENWAFLENSWVALLETASFENLFQENIQNASEKGKQEATLAEIIPLDKLPMGFKPWVASDCYPLVYAAGYDMGWGNSPAPGGTKVRDKLSDAFLSVTIELLSTSWRKATLGQRSQIFQGTEVFDQNGRIVGYSEYPWTIKDRLRINDEERFSREHDTKFSFFWEMFQIRHWRLDIDGYSWSNESLLKFFNDLVNETDDYSHGIKKHIFERYWDFVCADGLMEITYRKRPDWLQNENMPGQHKYREYHLNKLKYFIELLYERGDINLEVVYENAILAVQCSQLYEALLSDESLPFGELEWNILDASFHTRVSGSEWENPAVIMLLTSINSLVTSGNIIQHGSGIFGYNQPSSKVNLVGEDMTHNEDVIFSNVFLKEPLQSSDQREDIPISTSVWLKPAWRNISMHDLRRTFLFFIDSNYLTNVDILEGYGRSEMKNNRMIDWCKTVFNDLHFILNNRQSNDSDVRHDLDIFPLIWSQAIMIADTAIAESSTGGMMVCLSMISSLQSAYNHGLEVNSKNIHVRYEHSFSPWMENKSQSDFLSDFLEKSEKIESRLISELNEIEQGLGDWTVEQSASLFNLEWLKT